MLILFTESDESVWHGLATRMGEKTKEKLIKFGWADFIGRRLFFSFLLVRFFFALGRSIYNNVECKMSIWPISCLANHDLWAERCGGEFVHDIDIILNFIA
jgi:hypothetical protein